MNHFFNFFFQSFIFFVLCSLIVSFRSCNKNKLYAINRKRANKKRFERLKNLVTEKKNDN